MFFVTHLLVFHPITWRLEITTLGSILLPGSGTMAEAELVWYNCLTREVFTPKRQAWRDRQQTSQNTTYIVPTNLAPGY
jgi:hypothetical protein